MPLREESAKEGRMLQPTVYIPSRLTRLLAAPMAVVNSETAQARMGLALIALSRPSKNRCCGPCLVSVNAR